MPVRSSRCEATDVTVLTAPGSHDFDDGIDANVTVIPATCTENGSKTVKCSRCEATDVTVLTAPGHDFDETIEANVTVVEATCTGNGKKTVKCARCDETKETVLKPLGHDWGKWTVITPETETEKGVEQRVCARCGAKETRETGAQDDTPGCSFLCRCSLMKRIMDLFNRIVRLFTGMFNNVC